MNDTAANPPDGIGAAILSRVFSVPGIAVIAWLEYVLAIVLQARQQSALPLMADDAMRLVQVRDLLAGQSWFDVTQWRMNPPDGVAMHWSRLIDAPLAGLILFFRQFTDPQMAERLAISVWPMLLLLAAWLAIGRIATRLAGREAGVAALLLAITCVFTLGYFHPGEIDHHNAQLALTLWTVALLMEFERSPRAAAICGALCAISLAIGLETLPYVLAAAAIVSTMWIVRGNPIAPPVRGFGFAFAGTALFLLLAFAGARERFSADCLTFSGIYASFAIAGGAGIALLTFAPRVQANPYQRALGISCVALILFAILFTAAPQCAAGPYNWVTPELNRIWLSRIQEAQSPLTTAPYEIGFFFSSYVYAGLGMLATAAAIWFEDGEHRLEAIIVLIFSVVAFAVSSLEVRGTPFAVMLGLPGLAALIRLLALRYMKPGLRRASAMILALVLCSNVAFLLFGVYVLEGIDHVIRRNASLAKSEDCMGKDAVTPLLKLPQGQVAAFIDVPPTILLYTRDTVTAGSYRDPDAVLDVYRIFVQPPAASAAIIARRHVDYLMICTTSADYSFYKSEGGANGLLTQLAQGTTPAWLAPLPASGPGRIVRIYSVLRNRLK